MQTDFAAGSDSALSVTGIAGGGPPKLRRQREKRPRRPAVGVLPHRARPPRIPRQDIGREALRDAYRTLPDPVPVEMRIALRRLLLRMPSRRPIIGRFSPGASARHAKLWRQSWMLASSIPASSQTTPPRFVDTAHQPSRHHAGIT